LVIGTGWIDRNHIRSLLRHGGDLYTIDRVVSR
jgi:hypothetical protein